MWYLFECMAKACLQMQGLDRDDGTSVHTDAEFVHLDVKAQNSKAPAMESRNTHIANRWLCSIPRHATSYGISSLP